jgi:hypothetical protein
MRKYRPVEYIEKHWPDIQKMRQIPTGSAVYFSTGSTGLG